MDETEITKLLTAMDLIRTAIHEGVDPGVASVYLSVAGDYCKEISKIEYRKSLKNIERRETNG